MPRPLLRPRVVVLAVDLAGCRVAGERRPSGKRLAIAETARRFDEFGLPATWIIDGGAECRLAATLLDLGGDHEIALAADSSWVGRSVSRKTFASELSARQLRARANGYSVTSLFLDDAQQLVHTDLALKYGISAACPVAGGRRATRQVSRSARGPHETKPGTDSLQSICFGLWQVPVSLVLDGAKWESCGACAWGVNCAARSKVRTHRAVPRTFCWTSKNCPVRRGAVAEI